MGGQDARGMRRSSEGVLLPIYMESKNQGLPSPGSARGTLPRPDAPFQPSASWGPPHTPGLWEGKSLTLSRPHPWFLGSGNFSLHRPSQAGDSEGSAVPHNPLLHTHTLTISLACKETFLE